MINSNRVTKARKEINKLNSKYKNGYLYKKWIFRFFLVILLVIGVFTLFSNINNNNSVFDANNIANLNTNKFKNEIISLYEREGEKIKFINTMEDLENSIAIYLINNTTSRNNSFENLVRDTENKLNSKDWSLFNLDRNLYYSGKYILNEKGNLSFKFNKNVEPSWAKSIDKFIVLN